MRTPDVEAIVTFLTTEEGGRVGPAFSGYRPNHLIPPNYLTTGVHEYLDHEELQPGCSARAHITFMSPDAYPHSLSPGAVIRVQEGGRLIGHAEIVEVFNGQLLA